MDPIRVLSRPLRARNRARPLVPSRSHAGRPSTSIPRPCPQAGSPPTACSPPRSRAATATATPCSSRSPRAAPSPGSNASRSTVGGGTSAWADSLSSPLPRRASAPWPTAWHCPKATTPWPRCEAFAPGSPRPPRARIGRRRQRQRPHPPSSMSIPALAGRRSNWTSAKASTTPAPGPASRCGRTR